MKTAGKFSEKGLLYTDFSFPKLTRKWRGKVRDLYVINNRWLVMITTDRISAFDTILPVTIPHKGQILNQISTFFLEQAQQKVPVWIVGSPHPNVAIGLWCKPIQVEMIMRAYIAGSMWRAYKAGKRDWCGVRLPDGLKENQQLPEPVLTPTTKSIKGHDEDICPEEIIARGLTSELVLDQMIKWTRMLFDLGTRWAKSRGLILVDTKYEFGLFEDKLYIIDEVHTPDSSRYFFASDYHQAMREGRKPKQLSKEFVRQWLIEHGFMGEPNQNLPAIPESVVEETARRYQQVYELLTGQSFEPVPYHTGYLEEMYGRIIQFLKEVGAI